MQFSTDMEKQACNYQHELGLLTNESNALKRTENLRTKQQMLEWRGYSGAASPKFLGSKMFDFTRI